LGNIGEADRILIFSTTSNLGLLGSSELWHGDGTFKCSPGQFTQLYTIHCVKDNRTYPCVFALLPNKTESTYNRLLEKLKSLATEDNVNLNPKEIMADFEIGFINASKRHFPDAQQKGCFFHFSQCLWRKVQDNTEVAQKYKDDEFALNLRQVPALAFVPAHTVITSFETLMGSDFFTDNEQLLMPFVDYFEDVWIGRPKRGGGRRQPLFAHGIWNTFNSTTDGTWFCCTYSNPIHIIYALMWIYNFVITGNARTNNSVEGWNRRFSSLVGADHPSLWKFIDKLKEEQNYTEFRLNQAAAGAPPPPRRLKYRELETRLTNLVSQFNTKERIDYLSGIAMNISFHV